MRFWKVIMVVFVLLLAGCGQGVEETGGTVTSEDDASPEVLQEEDMRPATSVPCKGIPVERCDTVMPRTTQQAPATETVTIDASGEGDVEVRVEIADDMNEMARGLMGRTALAEDAGMLFVYPEERELSFWMRNTLIPLSIAYMDSEGRIVDIQDMRALDDEEPHYVSAEPAMYALEVNQGFFDERGVEVGDRARLSV